MPDVEAMVIAALRAIMGTPPCCCTPYAPGHEHFTEHSAACQRVRALLDRADRADRERARA